MAGALRRKMRLAFNLYETLNNNRLKTGDPLSARIYPAGTVCNETVTIAASGGIDKVTCLARGSIPAGTTNVVILRLSGGVWTEIAGAAGNVFLTDIEELSSAPGQYEFQIANSSASAIDIQPGDRIAARRIDTNLVTIYEEESADVNTKVNNPIDVPENGIVEGYVEERGVDVYVEGTTITDGWYGFNIPAGGGLSLRDLVIDTVTEASTIDVPATTSILSLTPGAVGITQLEHCAPGRLLIVIPNGAGCEINSLATKADNTIYEASPRTITLNADEALILIGVEGASSDIAYWVPLNTVAVNNLALGDLSDVSTAGAVVGDVVRYNGSSFAVSDVLGDSVQNISALHIASSGIQIYNGSGHRAILDSSGLTGTKIFTFPDFGGAGGQLMAQVGNMDISGNKRFLTGSGGNFQMWDGVSRVVEFSCSLITASTTRTVSWPDKSGTVAMTVDLKTNLNSLDDVTITSVATSNLLAYNGSNWVNTLTIGSNAAPLTDVVVGGAAANPSGDGLRVMGSSTGYVNIRERSHGTGTGFGVTAFEQTLGNSNGQLLLDQTNQKHATFVFPFNGSTDGLFNWLSNNNAIQLVAFNQDTNNAKAALWAIRKVNVQWHFDTSAAVASPRELTIYSGASIPTGGTVPPGSSTAQHTTPFTVPSSVTQSNTIIDAFETDAIVNNVGLGSAYMYLALSGGTNPPSTRGVLILDVEYVFVPGFKPGTEVL